MDAQAWQAVAYLILSCTAVLGGLWAAYTYRKTKRTEAARWVNDIFTIFYRDTAFLEAREVFEYQYWTLLRHALELRVTDRHVSPGPEEQDAIRVTDLILNFFEQLLYLEDEEHIATGDREVFFAYSFGILAYPSRASLRRYLACCGYERCARHVQAPTYELYVGALPEAIDPGAFEPVGDAFLPCRASEDGHLEFAMDQPARSYPLYRVTDRQLFRRLDNLFGFDAASLKSCQIVRCCIPTIARDGQASRDVWVYLDKSSVGALPTVLPVAGGGYLGL